jgi:hypothetical protein
LKSRGIVSISLDRPDVEAEGAVACKALNTIDFAGFPPHELQVKICAPVVLPQNSNIEQGLCNGTRIVIEEISPKAIKGRTLTGPFKDSEVLVPKMTLFHKGDSTVKVSFYRYQFLVGLAFAMTINKCQGQIMNYVGLVLENQPFAHGQLYVGLSRDKQVKILLVTQVAREATVTNVVNKMLFIEEDTEALNLDGEEMEE